MNDLTHLLQAAARGERAASDALLPLVYDELRRLAAVRMAREQPGHTLQTTVLVHDAWLGLAGENIQPWENRARFFAAAAQAMRRILITRARQKALLKHGAGQTRLNIADLVLVATPPDETILLLNDALIHLEKTDPLQARVVHLKFFAGLSIEETAETIGISVRTVGRQWACAKAWLYQWMNEAA